MVHALARMQLRAAVIVFACPADKEYVMSRWVGKGMYLASLLLVTPASAEVVLENARWRVALDPATLAIRAMPAGAQARVVSTGTPVHRVENLYRDAVQARWHWDDGAYQVQVRLDDADLALTISARTAGDLVIVDQPGSAMGDGWSLPLAEGHYVPRGHRVWQTFLTDSLNDLNTTQDLSLPLWSNDHGGYSLSWLMTEPFHNRLQLRADGDAIAIRLSHRFTSLDTKTPFTAMLHLGPGGPMAGAQRYRRWLIDSGRFEFLKNKLAGNPDAQKLPGATHVYLWGGGLLAPRDVKDWAGLFTLLRSDRPFERSLVDGFDGDARKVLAKAPDKPDRMEQRELIGGINASLDSLARQRWMVEEPDPIVLAKAYEPLRRQVVAAFGSVLEGDASDWGGGVSTRTFQSLQKAGLTRLWVGLGEGWEGGLWHPQAVAQAVSAGYLVAPYDSYETALKTGDNPDWATAHLGEKAYRDCAIEKADATLTSGFDGAGHYVDPRCVRPVLEARIRALHEAVPFNSWFLDAYGASMVFDSYRPQASMTERQNAQGNIASMRWLGESLRLVAGTEDGNAATASGYLFAHGMQTPVFGWGDPDMGNGVKKPCRSVYCLGGWYPSEQPTMFFKKVPVKELYRSVYFDPSYRLPLYQAVFHDSIVTTHHWSFDNLKLSNVHVENELAQLLYNVPPLYHLSADTLAQRLPAMKRQDAFFQPLHRVLATQAMTDFAWLSDDRLLQRTRFGDGTYLVANFSSAWRELEGRRLAPHSVTAVRPDGTVSSYTP